MDSRRFHQAGMKKCQAGNEEMQVIDAGRNAGGKVIFAMAYRKFRKD